MKRRRSFTLDHWCGGKGLQTTRALLTERGVEILAATNGFEVLRFRSSFGVGVVYRNLKGRLTANEQAIATFAMLAEEAPVSLAPVAVSKRRVTGERRAGEFARILERDGPGCFFCGGEFPPVNWDQDPGRAPTIEHLVAKAHGGPEHISNKFAAHSACNVRAGHLSAPEKIALRDRMRENESAPDLQMPLRAGG